ncbi:uncharacterized protein LOC111193656 [Astyanax mexicanus]|uniref:uncharacterized protein LOC111193656 n=1 Tax=Astyanax mexicanus TaxID=7994 RepID=UPI0020CAC3D2|nr:uncharacterized protein LOC111193656 [Astyanax mexicanus]
MDPLLYSQFQEHLINWCRGEELDENHAILIVGVPKECAIGQIEEAMNAVRCWGRVRVRGRSFDAKMQSLTVLCECKEKINPKLVPPEVIPEGLSERWTVIVTDGALIESDDFLKKLNGLLRAEGKTLDDLQGLCPQSTQPPSSTETIVQTMSELLRQNRSVSLEGHSYRRFRMFSGVIPTPAGEESLEHWLEQAYVMVEESECSEKEKKRRIMESVKGPALEVIKSVRSSEPEASPKTYLDALNTAFGSAESAEDVYFSFRLLQQRSGERLSDFLRRLEKSLTKVVQIGGLPSRDRDRVRVEQLLRGAVASDLLLVQLRLRERKNNPPSFVELLGEIRVQEEYLASRRQVNTAVRPVQTVETTESDQSVVLSLRAELKEGNTGKAAAAESDRLHCSSKRSAVEVASQKAVPSGLIGPSPIVQIKINGEPCSALLDSGSQVTIIFEEWHQKHLIDVPIQPVSGLAVWGLSESSYPYKGYVVVNVQFPKELVGVQETISVLALVCPGPRSPDQTPVILGTNANLFQRLAQLCKEAHGVDIAPALGLNRVFTQAAKTHPSVGYRGPDEAVGQIIWKGPEPLCIAPCSTDCVQCSVSISHPSQKGVLLVEDSDSLVLPQGLLLQPMVVSSSAIVATNFKVVLENESLKEVIVPAGTVVGQLYLTDTATPAMTMTTSVKIDPEHFKFADSPIPEYWKNRLKQKLSQRTKVFSLEEWDVGLAQGVEHRIRLNDSRPFRERSRRLAPADIEDVRRHIQDLLAAGIIKESRSPYASPIVVARKKNGSVRMCIDYRTLNSRTVPDQYTTPRVDDALDCLTGSEWFTVLDLRSGYYQIPVAEEDQEKTAFICPLGFYHFQRMPQGVSGAPATFQRLMEKVVGDMNLLQVLVYLDDLIIFGRSLEEHEERLLKVLDRLEEAGLKVSLDKCQFCQPRVKYVGHIVSAEGIATDPSKVEAVTNWPQPCDIKSLRSFLGFCGYYRRFIANYSSIVKPLTDLTRGYAPLRKESKPNKASNIKYFKESEPFGQRWTEACTKAFGQIKQCLTQAPVLAFADPDKPFILHVDASLSGLGAVLNQEHPDGLRPVAFASRGLNNAERNYHIHQLEFLALKWAVVDKFHDYLYGARFTVRTDNNPLTYVLTTAKLNATGHRWLAALTTYDFDIEYGPGKINTDADLLSRCTLGDGTSVEWRSISLPGIRAICNRVRAQESHETPFSLAELLCTPPEAIPTAYAFPTSLAGDQMELLDREDIEAAQESDMVIKTVKQALNTNHWPPELTPELGLMKREADKLVTKDGLLYRVKKRPSGAETYQLVLPQRYRQKVMTALHDDLGHLGVERTLEHLRNRFYWPKMAHEVEQYVKNCGECIVRKSNSPRAAPLHQITSSGPLDLVCIDFLSLEADSRGFTSILVVTDHFSRYAQAFPTKNQKAITVAKILVEKYFVHYGLPARIHSDQGRDFESQLIRELLKLLGVRKSRTTPYHPQGDPQPERFNRTLLSMLGTLPTSQKRQWSQHAASLVHAYNSTKNDATGYSPYFLMFGREARLPVDVWFGSSLKDGDEVTHSQYVKKLRQDLENAYRLAAEAADKSHQRNKKLYDKLVRFQALDRGDRVLLKNFGLKGKHKLQSRWNPIPYVVIGKMPNLPVYQVKPEKGIGSVKTIHRDHLLPIGQLVRLPSPADDEPLHRKIPGPKTRGPGHPFTAHKQTSRDKELLCSTSDSESEEDYEIGYTRDLDFVSAKTKENTSSYEVAHDGEEQMNDAYERDDVVLSDQEVSDDLLTQLELDPDTKDEGSSCIDKNVAPSSCSSVRPDVTQSAYAHNQQSTESSPSKEAKSSEDETPYLGKRQVKPIIRLTYDERGRSRDQPLTIVHRGVVIRFEGLESANARDTMPLM